MSNLCASFPLVECRILEVPQRYSASPAYLPVSFQMLNADSAFFLKEANQDIMRNSSLLSRTESVFIHRSRRTPSVQASYGPLLVEQPVPLELLQTPGEFVASSMFTFNWKAQTFIITDKVYLSQPKVQVLFYVSGRDWDDYSNVDKLPCVQMFAFHETQEVRGTCQLKGEMGLCVAELEPLAGWFGPPSVVPGRHRSPGSPEGTPVELYYMLQSSEVGDCPSEESQRSSFHSSQEQEGMFGSANSTPMKRIGSVRLYRAATELPLAEHRLDGNFVVLVPSPPVRQKDTVSAFIAAAPYSLVEVFTLRVKLKEGMAFLGARPSNPTLWMVSQDVRKEGHHVVTLHCRRKESIYGQRLEAGLQRVMQVDLEVLGGTGTPSISWTVEYQAGRGGAPEIETPVRLAQRELRGIVPLAMETEILNTAILNGKTVAIPVKVVSVGADSSVTDVSDLVECSSTDEDVVKVSDRCDYVYVNGKEQKGRVRTLVNFTYSYLSAQLEMSVWIPQLPLQIELSDSELSQIKGWRIPIQTGDNQRLVRDSEDDDEEDRRARTCTLQYQNAMVRVLTHFVAESGDGRGDLLFMLGSDWQVDITGLVWDFLKVEEPRIARLQQGRRLVGLDTGMTAIQVLSPLSDSILAERSVRVLDNRVSITELGLQLVSGLSLGLQLSPGSNRAILATATTQEVLTRPKQEALVSAWLHFSDGSMAPLDLYDHETFQLTATSLDGDVVSVRTEGGWSWPAISAESEGLGPLLRVDMTVRETCQKVKPRRSLLASSNYNIHVHFGPSEIPAQGPGGNNDYGQDGYEQEIRSGDRRPKLPSPPHEWPGHDTHYYGSSISDMEDRVMRRFSTTTTKTTFIPRPGGDKLSDDGSQVPINSDFPAQVDLPRGHSINQEDSSSDLLQTQHGLSDLEIGMYALLGVFCLAILVFLINCISYTLKYQRKELSIEGQDSVNHHAHDWVWLGNELELSPSPQAEEGATMMDSTLGGLEEGSQLLNGAAVQTHVQSQVHSPADGSPARKDAKGDSPTSKRKRVKFTTFTTVVGESTSPETDMDIKWVCPDLNIGESKELQTYMERLSDSTPKEVA
uniref:Transmembrane protein 132C n=1 Tax=Denticeps clupeoides TaxID=299321 RepID=A0AAY4CV24_9TELE